jgi:hypothetical protein
VFISTQKRPGSYALSMLILPAKASAVLGTVAVTGWSNDDLVNATYICTKRIP